jgi:hypothetical protein
MLPAPAALQGVGSHGAILQARCSKDSHIAVLTAMLTVGLLAAGWLAGTC